MLKGAKPTKKIIQANFKIQLCPTNLDSKKRIGSYKN